MPKVELHVLIICIIILISIYKYIYNTYAIVFKARYVATFNTRPFKVLHKEHGEHQKPVAAGLRCSATHRVSHRTC